MITLLTWSDHCMSPVLTDLGKGPSRRDSFSLEHSYTPPFPKYPSRVLKRLEFAHCVGHNDGHTWNDQRLCPICASSAGEMSTPICTFIGLWSHANLLVVFSKSGLKPAVLGGSRNRFVNISHIITSKNKLYMAPTLPETENLQDH